MLVIFMMIVLVTLGTFAISSAHVNYQFSEKALEWNKAYYDCDAQAERFLADYDAVLAAAEKMTVDYILRRGFAQEKDEGVPLDLQQRIRAENFSQRDGALAGVNLLYSYYIEDEMQSLRVSYPDVSLGPGSADAEIMFQANENALSRLRVQITAAPLRYDFRVHLDTFAAVSQPNATRYQILRWEQCQDAPDVYPTQEPLWGGGVD
ncbi:MAG: hypothetical protein LBT44_04725 [Clostridiales bacterium]|nr:hypothetical protein [Clostridiales bacterium]